MQIIDILNSPKYWMMRWSVKGKVYQERGRQICVQSYLVALKCKAENIMKLIVLSLNAIYVFNISDEKR